MDSLLEEKGKGILGADRGSTTRPRLSSKRGSVPLRSKNKCSPSFVMESGHSVELHSKEFVMESAYTALTLRLILTTSGGNALGFRKYKKNSSEMKKRCNNFLHSKPSGNLYILGCFGLE